MKEHISSLDDNFNKIKNCFLHTKRHTFCVDCLERKTFDEDPCQLCRPFYAIPDIGCGGYSRDDLMEKRVDLHESFMESFVGRNLTMAEKTVDIPLVVEQFILEGVHEEEVLVAWLDNKIYVTYFGIKKVRVFTDQTPFTELPTPIHIKELDVPRGMVASTFSNSIFVSDCFCIWKFQLPNNKLSRIRVNSAPTHLSITPDNELLVVMEDTSLDILSLKDLSRIRSIIIDVPFDCDKIFCAAQLPNKNIIISYTEDYHMESYWFCILTTEGGSIRTTFEPRQRDPHYPTYFTFDNDGQFFIADTVCGGLLVFKSQLFDLHVISDIKLKSYNRPRIVCMKSKQQLLVSDKSNDGIISISLFHLSPCDLIRGRSDESLLPFGNKSRIKIKRKAKRFPAGIFQKIKLKKRRR